MYILFILKQNFKSIFGDNKVMYILFILLQNFKSNFKKNNILFIFSNKISVFIL